MKLFQRQSSKLIEYQLELMSIKLGYNRVENGVNSMEKRIDQEAL